MGRLSLCLVVVLFAACASPQMRSESLVTAPLVHLNKRVDPATGVESVAYGPVPVTAAGRPGSEDDFTLHVGALYAARPADGSVIDELALFFVGRTSTGEPLFGDDRRVLLDVDGELLTHAPEEAGSTYDARRQGRGMQETLVVPVSREVMEHMASAGSIGGRVGLWITFDLKPRSSDGFRALLEALPPGALEENRSVRGQAALPIS